MYEPIFSPILKIHFLNVGHGDCTIIDFPGDADGRRLTIIDSNHLDDNDYEDVATYIKTHFPGRNIFRFIMTHPHKDHISGLIKFKEQGIRILHFWDLNHNFGPEKEGGHWDNYKYDWEEYQRIQVDSSIPSIKPMALEQGQYWTNDGITVLAPDQTLIKDAHTDQDGNSITGPKVNLHRMNYVLLITHGKFKLLIGGDADKQCWDFIYNMFYTMLSNPLKRLNLLNTIRPSIFLAPHHASETSFHEELFSFLKPQNIIISSSKDDLTNDNNMVYEYAKLGRVHKTAESGTITVNAYTTGEYKFFKTIFPLKTMRPRRFLNLS
ncbi:hypothetical protein CL633_01310 [bacterium]|nr:hypothetical protein [bacterium]|tara:strand:+ start:6446 stop:7414 length:969 start_codon:yes stop_codon:yes gene_type:complete